MTEESIGEGLCSLLLLDIKIACMRGIHVCFVQCLLINKYIVRKFYFSCRCSDLKLISKCRWIFGKYVCFSLIFFTKPSYQHLEYFTIAPTDDWGKYQVRANQEYTVLNCCSSVYTFQHLQYVSKHKEYYSAQQYFRYPRHNIYGRWQKAHDVWHCNTSIAPSLSRSSILLRVAADALITLNIVGRNFFQVN